MVTAYIGLGSNLGDRGARIREAVAMLAERKDIRLGSLSRLLETDPIGPPGQPKYLNAVLRIETELTPLSLLDVLQSIEAALGRVRKEKWGPRTIDLDILQFGNETMNHPRLTLPHPEISRRPFVQVGLKELAS